MALVGDPMHIISAKTREEAKSLATLSHLPTYIYLPIDDKEERQEILRLRHSHKKEELLGVFTYSEIQWLMRKVG